MNPQILQALQKLQATSFKNGDVIYEEGAMPDNTMYFLLAGEIGFYKKRADTEREINRQQPGTFFGEMALVQERPRLATARVLSKEAKMIVMNREILLKLSGSAPQFLFHLLRHSVSRLLAGEDKLQRVREEVEKEKQARGF